MDLGGSGHQYSRKQKSLGLLCTNFVSMYKDEDVETVGLDDAAKRLGVERRRIYDIVNVLESVGVLARKAKNRYSWIGFAGIPKALETLKEDASRENFGSLTERASLKLIEKDFEDEEDDKSVDQNEDYGETKLKHSSCSKERSDNRREKSLGLLTENFVKLFLTTQADTISLDEAARLLLVDGHDSSQVRSNNNAAKVRRLYDIANVLSSLNLIEKTHQVETRKPAFRWLGLNGKRNNDVTVAIPPSPKQRVKRAFGMDITNVDIEKRIKVVSSVDKKPTKLQMRTEDLRECNITAQKQLHSSNGFVFGPFAPVRLDKVGASDENKGGKRAPDWETLASTFRPDYHNQALSELFAHYKEAWKRWYAEVTQTDNL